MKCNHKLSPQYSRDELHRIIHYCEKCDVKCFAFNKDNSPIWEYEKSQTYIIKDMKNKEPIKTNQPIGSTCDKTNFLGCDCCKMKKGKTTTSEPKIKEWEEEFDNIKKNHKCLIDIFCENCTKERKNFIKTNFISISLIKEALGEEEKVAYQDIINFLKNKGYEI